MGFLAVPDGLARRGGAEKTSLIEFRKVATSLAPLPTKNFQMVATFAGRRETVEK